MYTKTVKDMFLNIDIIFHLKQINLALPDLFDIRNTVLQKLLYCPFFSVTIKYTVSKLITRYSGAITDVLTSYLNSKTKFSFPGNYSTAPIFYHDLNSPVTFYKLRL